MESEFVPAARGIQDAMGLLPFGEGIGSANQITTPTQDGQSGRNNVHYEASSSTTKHIDIKYKFIQDFNRYKVILPTYVTAIEIKADILTKSRPGRNFVRL